VRVIGALLGAWGKERYGMKPVKVDALDFYPARMTELKRQIREAEPLARSDFYPTSFVTFRCRHHLIPAPRLVVGAGGTRANILTHLMVDGGCPVAYVQLLAACTQN
jgi:hypothetical protein